MYPLRLIWNRKRPGDSVHTNNSLNGIMVSRIEPMGARDRETAVAPPLVLVYVAWTQFGGDF